MSPENSVNERTTKPRTYDIFEDQIRWLDNSSLNKSKKMRELLDNFINEVDATVIQNLKDEITQLNEMIRVGEELHIEEIKFLKVKIESQKSVIVALGGKE